MSMNTDSFSVLKDNQKTYAQTSRAVNPYASKEEQMAQVKHSQPDLCPTKFTMQKCDAALHTRARPHLPQTVEPVLPLALTCD